MNKVVYLFVVSIMAVVCGSAVFAQNLPFNAAESEAVMAGMSVMHLSLPAGVLVQDNVSLPKAVPVAAEAETEADKAVQSAANANYFPVSEGTVFTYEHTSSEFKGVRLISIGITSVTQNDGGFNATAVISENGKAYPKRITFTRNARGIYASNSIIGGKRKEFPLPLKTGKQWNEDSDINRISSLTASVSIPAGHFAGCLKVSVDIGGGDAGHGERFYAPGVGLVYEESMSEGSQDIVKLVSFMIK